MAEDLLVAQDGPILRVTLNRADSRVTDEMAIEITKIMDGAAERAAFVVLRAAAPDFCLGWRPTGNAATGGKAEAWALRDRFDVVFNCYGSFRRAKVPIVGVVRGRAAGFGCALATLCDITIADDAATFQVPEMLQNIVPTMVMSSLFDRVAYKALSYLVYTTTPVVAARAREMGIISEVAPRGGLDGAVEALCTALLDRPAPGLKATKEYLLSAQTMDTLGAVNFARNLHATVNSSSDMRPRH